MSTTHSWIDTQDQAKIEVAITKSRATGWTHRGSSRNFLEAAGGDERFALWLILADRAMARLIGLGIHDIADADWSGEYESGSSPAEAVTECLRNDDDFSVLFDGSES